MKRKGVNQAPLPGDEREQLRLLLESVQDYAIFLLDAAGRIVTWTSGVRSILGYEEAEFVGQNVALLFTPEDRERGRPEGEMRAAATHGRAADERWYLRKDGSRFFASASLTALRDENGALRGYSKVLRDSTERRRLREQETRRFQELRYLTTRARALLWHGTVRQTGPDDYAWDTRVFDEEAARTFFPLELLPDERYTQAWYRQRLPEGQALTDRLSREAFREHRGSYHGEFGCKGRDGEIRWFSEEVYVEPLAPGHWRVVGVALDITERKRQEEALKASEERFRLLVEGVREYAIFMLDPQGNVATWNRSAERILGYAADEILGRHFSLFYTPEDRERGVPEQVLREAEARGRFEEEGQRVRKDGSRFWVSVALTALRDDAGNLRGFAKVSRDVTERKAVEAEREAQSERNRRIAETLQRSMLIAPARGAFPGLEVETLYQAALEEAAVGGDFFDAFSAGGSRVALVVGDVSGKGLAAAQRTSQIKYALRAFVQEYTFPARALGRLNRLVYDTLNEDNRLAFVTVSLAVVDTAAGRATFTLAGAESPLLLRSGGRGPKLIEAAGLPLGIDPEADYAAEVVELSRDDTLLLFTDGLTEARVPRGPLLEYEGLFRLAEEAQQVTTDLREMAETILGAARAFSGGSFRDDVCLLLARWAPS